MKRILAAFLAAAVAFPFPAQAVVAPVAPLVPAAALARIGVAAAVNGLVTAQAPGQAAGRVIGSGLPLYVNDHVTTGPGGRLQILLLDQTTFTLGPNSDMVLDEFVYDPSTNAGKLSARIVKGVFRFVSGKIAHHDSDTMKVRLPSATIGIRGTMVAGHVEGMNSEVALLGPGPANNAREAPGGITVFNTAGSVRIDRGGFFTSVRGSAPPAPPAPVTSRALANWIAKIDAKQSSGANSASGNQGNTGPANGNSNAMNGRENDDSKGQQNENRFRKEDNGQSNENQYKGKNDEGRSKGMGGWSGYPGSATGGSNNNSGNNNNSGYNNNSGFNNYSGNWNGYTNGTEMSGEGMAAGATLANTFNTQFQTTLDQVTAVAGQDVMNVSVGTPDGATTWGQLQGLLSGGGTYIGAGTYGCTGGVCGTNGNTSIGDFAFKIAVAFGQNATIGGGNSNITLISGPLANVATGIQQTRLAPPSGATSLSPAVGVPLTPTNPDFAPNLGVAGAGPELPTISFGNNNGQIANLGFVTFSYLHAGQVMAGSTAPTRGVLQ